MSLRNALGTALAGNIDRRPDSPEVVRRRRAMADALLGQGAQTQNVDSPIEALGSIAQSFGGFLGGRRADRDEEAGLQSRRDALTRISESYFGGSSNPSPMGFGSTSTPTSSGGSDGQTAASAAGVTQNAANTQPIELASSLLGAGEVPNRSTIQEYLKNGGVNLDPATTAWCAAYVNSTLAQTGFEGTGSNMARSFLNYGEAVDTPQRGDLAVFSRGDPNGPFGHVGFFEGLNDDGTIRVLGGNQSDSVSIAGYSPNRLLGYRRPVSSGTQVASLNANEAMASALGAEPAQQTGANSALVSALTSDSTPAPQTAPQMAPSSPAPSSGQQDPMVAQLLGGQQAQPAPGVNRALIAELLGNPWTEDMGQTLLMQGITQQQEAQALARQQAYDRAVLNEQRQYDAGLLQGERAYDDRVRQEGFQREDGRFAVSDAREDARLRLERQRFERDGVEQPQWQELPNGDFGYFDPNTREFERLGSAPKPAPASGGYEIELPDGTRVAAGGTEQVRRNQQLYSVVLPELETVNRTFDAMSEIGNQVGGAFGTPGNFVTTPEYQMGRNALQTIVRSYLYSVSGAAATDQEVYGQTDILIPKPGDDPQTVSLKKQRVQTMVNAIGIVAGIPAKAPAFGAPEGLQDPVLSGVGSSTPDASAMPTATNPETGEMIQWNGREWVPMQ